MSVFHENMLLGAQATSSQYQIQRSIRLNAPDSAYLSRTPASAGNRKTWTWSGWVKRAQIAGTNWIFSAGNIDTTQLRFTFLSTDTLTVDDYASSAYQLQLITTQLFRDPSAWYHIVLSVDTTQATAADRAKLYVNGSQITTFSTSTYYSQNYDTQVNTASLPHRLGAAASTTAGSVSASLNAYLADIHFIDGQALTPSSFGETDATTGEWIPKAYTGTYGTNGFKLDFSNNSAATATTLGADSSGNGNNWTPNNLSVTAGAGNDSLVDTPTSYGTDTGVGGEVRGNYCTWNPLQNTCTLTNGNLDAAYGSGTFAGTRGTFYVSSGKWYWEVTVGTITASVPYRIGIAKPASSVGSGLGGDTNSYNYSNDGQKSFNGTNSAYGATYTGGDIIGVALDLDTGALAYYKNGVSQGTAFTSITGSFAPAVELYTGQTSGPATANFGQRPFAYPVSGFKALCDTNLPAPTIVKPSTVMDVKLYTGNGSTQTISGLGFSPDLVWIKTRSISNNHMLMDVVRGSSAPIPMLHSSSTTNEAGFDTTWRNTYGDFTAFTSDGFTVVSGSSSAGNLNSSTVTHAAWCWDAGSSTVTNTAGTITSQVRANASAGFSIVTYTGGATNATVGHGLGVAPSLILCKCRSAVVVWVAYHKSLGKDAYIFPNQTDAASTGATNYWGTTGPDSTTFGVATAGYANNQANMVAYCFAPVAGYSAFGSYTGNGSATDGPFVYCGFRPRWIMVKRTTSDVSGGNWIIKDALRNGYNDNLQNLYPNLSAAEQSFYSFDILSNGFKVRSTDVDINGSAATYIYAAFAEFPFQYARAR